MKPEPHIPDRPGRNSKWPIIALILAGVCLAGGLFRLLQLRFSTGDNYPMYSSFRTDPLGTKLLFDSLYETERGRVDRNFKPLTSLHSPQPEVLIWLGEADFDDWSDPSNYQPLLDYIKTGNTVILALKPDEKSRAGSSRRNAGKFKGAVPTRGLTNKLESLLTTLQVSFTNISKGGDAVLGWSEHSFPASIPWSGNVGFQTHTSEWVNVYSVSQVPVVLHRRFGRGTMFLTSSSYPFSNEALQKQNPAGFIAALIPQHGRIRFDENHLGSVSHAGVSDLIRKYHLEGSIVALFILGLLFIWRCSVPLLPHLPESAAGPEMVSGLSTFARLLRRSIPEQDLLRTCMVHWKTYVMRRGVQSQDKTKQAERCYQEMTQAKPDGSALVATYNKIAESINQRKS